MAAGEQNGRRWQPFGIQNDDYGRGRHREVKVVNLRLTDGGPGRAGGWLRGALIALAALAAAAAAASWDAQYVMVAAARHDGVAQEPQQLGDGDRDQPGVRPLAGVARRR